jgi:tetratricopeptide (TPR) repeat protein
MRYHRCNQSGYLDSRISSPSARFAQQHIVHILLIALFGLLAYCNTFHSPFQFDDTRIIEETPVIRDLHYFLSPSKAKDLVEYFIFKRRFVGYLTFALNYAVHGLEVTGYHAVNLLIHITNALLVYWLVRLSLTTSLPRDFTSPSGEAGRSHATLIALFSSLLFVTHPIQTQAVTYIVQRFASLATTFYLLSLIMYIRARLNLIKGRTFLSLSVLTPYSLCFFSAVLAMKTKEIAFTLPVVITLYELMFFKGKAGARILLLIPVILTLCIIPLSLMEVAKVLAADNAVAVRDVENATRLRTFLSRDDYFLTQCRAVVTYIRLIFFPVRQSIDYDYPIYHSLFELPVFLSSLFLLLIAFLGMYLFVRWGKESIRAKLISLGIFWFFITMTVESSIIPIVDVFVEHRVYLPSVGAFIAISAGVFALFEIVTKRGNAATLAAAALAAIVIVFTVATYSRNVLWQDRVALWEDTVRKHPLKGRAWENLALGYYYQGDLDKTLEIYARVGLIAREHYNHGVSYHLEGDFKRAIDSYTRALDADGYFIDALRGRAAANRELGRNDFAIADLKQALSINPDIIDLYRDLGAVYLDTGRGEDALKNFNEVIARAPGDSENYVLRGETLLFMKDVKAALNDFRKACDMGNGNGCTLAERVSGR